MSLSVRPTPQSQLIEGLLNMINGGRLTEADIPDDFEWLKRAIANVQEPQPLYCAQLDVESDKFDRLPRQCMIRHVTSGKPILVCRGETGYRELHPDTDVDRYNQERGITEEQIEAMEAGSAFGWDCEAADPKRHVEQADGWTCPGCHTLVEPSLVRSHRDECNSAP